MPGTAAAAAPPPRRGSPAETPHLTSVNIANIGVNIANIGVNIAGCRRDGGALPKPPKRCRRKRRRLFQPLNMACHDRFFLHGNTAAGAARPPAPCLRLRQGAVVEPCRSRKRFCRQRRELSSRPARPPGFALYYTIIV